MTNKTIEERVEEVTKELWGIFDTNIIKEKLSITLQEHEEQVRRHTLDYINISQPDVCVDDIIRYLTTPRHD